MKYRWQINEKLTDDQETKPLRKLLHDQWLLPSRLIHYLRIRRTVLVNGKYRSMNELEKFVTTKLLLRISIITAYTTITVL